MTIERIKEIHQATAYPESLSVQLALLQVWNECANEEPNIQSELEKARELLKYANQFVKHQNTSKYNEITTFLNEGKK